MRTLKPGQRVLLIEPPFYTLFGYKRWHYPVTLTLIGSYLEARGHAVAVLDADRPKPGCRSLSRTEVRANYPMYASALENADHPAWAEIVDTVRDYQPDWVGVTSITAKFDAANRVARLVRETCPEAQLVLGGPHVQGMLKYRADTDFGPDWDEVVPRIPELVDQTPRKRLLMHPDSYSEADFSSILTSSGCPNVCTFCCHSYEKQFVYRGLASIREELDEIQERSRGNGQVYIMDDCFFSNARRFEEISTLIQEREMSFTAGSRVMALSQEKLQKFCERGGKQVYVGIESGSQTVLDRVKKRLQIPEILRRTRWLNEVEVPWSAFVIVGFPFETLDDLKRTRDLVYAIEPTFVSINRFTPYPGTELFSEFFADQPIRYRELFQLSSQSCLRLSNEIEAFIDDLFLEFDRYNESRRQSNPTLSHRS